MQQDATENFELSHILSNFINNVYKRCWSNCADLKSSSVFMQSDLLHIVLYYILNMEFLEITGSKQSWFNQYNLTRINSLCIDIRIPFLITKICVSILVTFQGWFAHSFNPTNLFKLLLISLILFKTLFNDASPISKSWFQ
jgi:hypothetical protein